MMKTLLLFKQYCLLMAMLLAVAMPSQARQVWDIPIEWDGDVNRDGSVNIGDVADLIDALLENNLDSIQGDVNVDGMVNIGDVVDLIDMLLTEPDEIVPAPLDTIRYNMVYVRSDTYTMGATPEQEPYATDAEYAAHQVKQYPFYIGQTEVTQDMWRAVMGGYPSAVKGKKLPVTNVTWEQCQEFIYRLNRFTGRRYRLPTEAEWELAARGGRIRHGYVYAGSNTLADVGWYDSNSAGSPHKVAMLSPNELKIYDMSGNVWEWCQDYWADSYGGDYVLNPLGPVTGTARVLRGGSWMNIAANCRVSTRYSQPQDASGPTMGFRLAMDAPYENWFLLSEKVVYLKVGEQKSVDILNGNGSYTLDYDQQIVDCHVSGEQLLIKGNKVGTTNVIVTDNLTGDKALVTAIVYRYVPKKQDDVFGVTFNMIYVEGGIAKLGATEEQAGEAYSSESPAHHVTLSNFSIGETEVTQALWQAVMGSNPSYFTGDLELPVERVSWVQCMAFLDRLNDITGKDYRLPTEAEWEYAARGGIFRQGYKYAGSDVIDDVAWHTGNSGSKTHAVATKQPNELGIFDMTGNVWEWCQDWYAAYTTGIVSDPTGPATGSSRVNRGGSFSTAARMCRVSYRRSSNPTTVNNSIGLRLAIDEPGTHRFGLSRHLVRMEVGEHRTLDIFNGSGDYTIFNEATDIVESRIDGECLLLTGMSAGTTDVVVKDNITGAQAMVTVIVTQRRPPEIIPVLNDTIWMEYVKGGTFDMGGTSEQASTGNNDKPVHQVTLSSYYICNREVTQHLWYAVMGRNPSKFNAAAGYGDDLYKPVESVSWYDCQRFIARLNMMTGMNFRLPTEAEWEFAARGGTRSEGYRFAGSNTLADVGWYKNNSNNVTHHCMLKATNELDLYDMSGNVGEWCQDWYSTYGSDPLKNPIGGTSGNLRVWRGGSWNHANQYCRNAYRNALLPSSTSDYVGLRLAMDAEDVESPDGGDVYPRFRLSRRVVTLEVGEQVNLSILHGSGNYTVINNEEHVLADIEGSTLTLTGKSVGIEDVIVRDNDKQAYALVTAIVVEPTPPDNVVLDDSVTFDMVYIPEGAFIMGDDAVPGAAPAHYVSVNDYYIGSTEVTNLMWRWVMDYPINWSAPDLYKPVEGLSWEDAQDFIARLNEKTGRQYRLPTEAEWEYAAMGANRSHGYRYAGSNVVGDVAWYWDNLPSQQIGTSGYGVQRVKMKSANEKGIYDMSGNVREWCQDWFGVYPMSIQVNPMGPETGSDRVVRGGCYLDSSDPCRVKARSAARPSLGNYVGTGFRLAMDAIHDTVTPGPTPSHYDRLTLSESVIRIPVGGQRQVNIYYGSGSYTLYNSHPTFASCLVEGEKLLLSGLMEGTTVVKVVDNITLSTATLTVIVYKPSPGVLPGPDELFNEPKMIYVHGGTFVRGATSEQGTSTDANEQPIHQVTVSNYYISQTEVTQRLWERVMGGNPSKFKGDSLPVEQVTWEDCQEFIRRLNQMTGRQYRMLTEAEWEFAARGGRLSMGYKYAGGNLMTPLGWYKGNSSNTSHGVAMKSPNELDIYDMSGNVWEWCQDCYGDYGSDNLFNPVGPDPEFSSGTINRVMRGGAWDGVLSDCRVARRLGQPQDYCAPNVGLRLAMDAYTPQLTVRPRVVELKKDESATVSILNGYGDYTATGGGSVASFQLSGSSLTVTGQQVGTTTINIKDNTTLARTSVTVIVTETHVPDTCKTITFWIRYISGGAFDMGATDEQGSDAGADESPVHRAMVPAFGIGETEVTQELWTAVMGYNPSVSQGDLQQPVDNVTWEEAEQFVARLSDLCDKPYRLPTEAEWEYAARGGHYGSPYKYAGSNAIGKVAWYSVNSGGKSHPVASKVCNEEYLYDMSGNVDEWCHDWYAPYSAEPVFDPEGPDSAEYHVARGGRWDSPAAQCRVSARSADGFGETLPGVRIALERPYSYWFYLSRNVVWLKVGGSRTVDIYNGSGSYTIYPSRAGIVSYVVEGDRISLTGLKEGRTVLQVMDNVSHKHKTITVIVRNPIVPLPDDDPDEDPDPILTDLKMIYVRGGTFAMGATSEQGSDAANDENPSHLVTLSSYYVSETEVTQALWKRVMGGNPSHFKGDNLPVEQVTWEDCQEFISRINSLTGRQYRLLTEAEWEYAARGGTKGNNYKYAGSNTIGNVAWYSDNSSNAPHIVKQKYKNELGIYDMSGNVAEWCQDVYGAYSADNQNNPVGAAPDAAVCSRVVRGGAWDGDAGACRVSSRSSQSQDYCDSHIGLRLARDANDSGDDGPMVVTHRLVEMEVGEQATVGIVNGSGNYAVAGGGGIVSYSLSGSTLTLTALAEGKTTVNIKDNTSNVWTIITVIVTDGEIPYKYRNITFWIKYISGGAFDQGATEEQGTAANADESPVHRSLVPAYGIGKTEITQELWQAVMGYNNSINKGNLQLPVDNVSWDEAQEFVARLSDIFDLPFRLPTEAEWEYAARGARGSKGYKYSGGNSASTVAWYSSNSSGMTHAVGTKRGNERKLYDMSGNVDEWCQDWYGPYSDEPVFDPLGPVTGDQHVVRGGRWDRPAADCRVSARSAGGFGTTLPGLRVALEYPYSYYLSLTRQTLWMEVGDNRYITIHNGSGSYTVSSSEAGVVSYVVNGDKLLFTALNEGHTTVTVLDNVAQESKTVSITVVQPAGTNEPDDVDGAEFEMIYVRGGTFMMGGTEEQGTDVYNKEKPAHRVTLNDFKISNIEVTQELWQNVMGSNPSTFTGNLQYPVDNVSWEDCQTFIAKLNEKTGKHYRLPTEAEWEYAARGGARSLGYKYAGGNTIGNVAWYSGNASSKTHVVGTSTMTPNELGIYDMSGNVMEWCQDWYGSYTADAQTNPTGATSGTLRAIRGGSWKSVARSCRVSHRQAYGPTAATNEYGLRLAEDVNNPLRFGLSSTMLTMEPGTQQTVSILNGSGDYTLDAGSSVVTCVLSGETITVTANQVGATTVSVTDNATGESVILTVIVTQPVAPFGLSQDALTMDVGQTATVNILNGRGNYTVSSSTTGIVTATISGDVLSVKALKAGTTTVIVTDVLTQSTATLTVTVNQPIIPLSLPYSELTIFYVSEWTIPISNGSGSFAASVEGTSVSASISSGRDLIIVTLTTGVSTVFVTDLITGDIESIVVTVIEQQRGDVNLDGVIDENDYGELYSIVFKNKTPQSTYTADVNADGTIDKNQNYGENTDINALIDILYSDLMKSWNGYPFNDISTFSPKYDINGDGQVNIADFNSILYCAYNGSVPYGNGDLDGDGSINWRDVCIFHVAYMRLQNLWPEEPTEHEYVDLGLPSGTLWATCNVGANTPEEYGDYFAWGETEPKETYDWSTYKWCNGTDNTLTKYCTNSYYGTVDNKAELDPEDDAAYVNWGSSWRMPSRVQCEELIDNCTKMWTTQNGVNGYLVTGPNGNTLFLPAAGSRIDNSLSYPSNGYYWSRVYDSSSMVRAYDLCFNWSNWDSWLNDYRDYGHSVRPVRASESTINEEEFTVNGVTFTMTTVEGGIFPMGNSSDSESSPVHQVTLSDYKIGKTEVTQALWNAVMGNNPSRFTGDLQRPVEKVSWNDCQAFILKLNQMTGKRFRLPTEAEWEFAARGGNRSQGYNYSGSNTLGNVAWYGLNSNSVTHTVSTKAANELGLYDMSGNVFEWCQDWYGSYNSTAQTNPTGTASATYHVNRGGCWSVDDWPLTMRSYDEPTSAYEDIGLRLALDPDNSTKFCLSETVVSVEVGKSTSVNILNDNGSYILAGNTTYFTRSISSGKLTVTGKAVGTSTVTVTSTSNGATAVLTVIVTEEVIPKETFTVNGVSFNMVTVEGGTFTMGGTSEQGSDADDIEKPTHQVTLSTYKIGETEVTQALWVAVMGSNPSYITGNLQRPVEWITWNECQEFILKLNQLTGKQFRLPTEAEWEFAARGGNRSQGYKYSGSNTASQVAWYDNTSSNTSHPVASKSANELGIYDMSGNVFEWCLDRYGSYSSSAQTNPMGSATDSRRVRRGGAWPFALGECRVSYRNSDSQNTRYSFDGLRLALDEDNSTKFRMASTVISVGVGSSKTVNILNGNGSYSVSGSSVYVTTSISSNKLTVTGKVAGTTTLLVTNTSTGAVAALTVIVPKSATSTETEYDVNGVKFKMVTVTGGTFTMGGTSEQGSDVQSTEQPTHSVTLSNFFIGQTEVTQDLWYVVMGSNPSAFNSGDWKRPVESVSWNDCQEFILKLNQLTGKKFRLPTEAEWEFAARGGTQKKGYKYSGSSTADDVAWFIDNCYSQGRAYEPVASKAPNELGLYDMSGNLYEWCLDWFSAYSTSAQTNPTGSATGTHRMIRGGCWGYEATYCRVSYRDIAVEPTGKANLVGLRLALDPDNSTKFRMAEPVVTVEVGKSISVSILNGNGSYSVAGSTTNFSRSIVSGKVKVTGTAVGTNTVTVTNTSTGATAVLTVIVTEAEHEYVDLGLPSGTLWATCNVGASSPEEYGDYFAWGETEPKDPPYNWTTYKWCSGTYRTMTKYCTSSTYGTVDNKTELELTDDAAYVNWGASWRMPTTEQQQELIQKCTWAWTTRNGVRGQLATGPNGNTLFMPAAGNYNGSTLYSSGSDGYYWSRTVSSSGSNYANAMFVDSSKANRGSGGRASGYTVRAVRVQ